MMITSNMDPTCFQCTILPQLVSMCADWVQTKGSFRGYTVVLFSLLQIFSETYS